MDLKSVFFLLDNASCELSDTLVVLSFFILLKMLGAVRQNVLTLT